MADNNKTTALIAIKVGDQVRKVVIEDIDFERPNNEVAFKVGNAVLSNIFDAAQEDARG